MREKPNKTKYYKLCKVCQSPFKAALPLAKFCSNSCRQTNHQYTKLLNSMKTFILIAFLAGTSAASAQSVYKPAKGDTVTAYKKTFVLQRDTIRHGAHLWYAVSDNGRGSWLNQKMITKKP